MNQATKTLPFFAALFLLALTYSVGIAKLEAKFETKSLVQLVHQWQEIDQHNRRIIRQKDALLNGYQDAMEVMIRAGECQNGAAAKTAATIIHEAIAKARKELPNGGAK